MLRSVILCFGEHVAKYCVINLGVACNLNHSSSAMYIKPAKISNYHAWREHSPLTREASSAATRLAWAKELLLAHPLIGSQLWCDKPNRSGMEWLAIISDMLESPADIEIVERFPPNVRSTRPPDFPGCYPHLLLRSVLLAIPLVLS